MKPFCDLHTHSHFSDGSSSPTQLLRSAESIGLSAIALCDHNTVTGLPEFLSAAQDSTVEAIPGAEFSTDYRGTELHILGLFLNPEYYEQLSQRMADFHKQKEQSNIALIASLNEAGYDLDYAQIRRRSKGDTINRAHIAAALTEQGYTPSIQAAFSGLLKPGNGHYIPPSRPDPFATISYIKSIGAVAVLAHPLLNLREAQLTEFLSTAVQHGLDGMETLYSKYSDEQIQSSKALTKRFGLLESGDSDYHGDNKPDIKLGTGRGNLHVPLQLLDGLRNAAKNDTEIL